MRMHTPENANFAVVSLVQPMCGCGYSDVCVVVAIVMYVYVGVAIVMYVWV